MWIIKTVSGRRNRLSDNSKHLTLSPTSGHYPRLVFQALQLRSGTSYGTRKFGLDGDVESTRRT